MLEKSRKGCGSLLRAHCPVGECINSNYNLMFYNRDAQEVIHQMVPPFRQGRWLFTEEETRLRGTSWTGGTLSYREVKWFAQHYTAMQWGAVLKLNKSVPAVASSIYETVMLGCRITRPSQTLNNWIKRKGPRLKRKKDLWIVKFVKHWNNSLREYYWHFLSRKVLKYRRNTDWLTLGMGYPFWENRWKEVPLGRFCQPDGWIPCL